MTPEQEILAELKKINDQLAKQSNGVGKNFLLGFFHSLGTFVGYIAIVLILAYFASKFNFMAIMSKSFEDMMSQINWTKIVPQPKINFPIN